MGWKRNWIALLFVVVSTMVSAQQGVEQIEKLQKQLEDLQLSAGDTTGVEQYNIEQELGHFDTLQRKYDSLLLEMDLLQSELLIAKTKLAACQTKVEKYLPEDVGEDELSEGEKGMHAMKVASGYYIVISSFRLASEADTYLAEVKKSPEKDPIAIFQNHRRSWYHICVSKPYTREEIGKQVARYREGGYSNAWYIRVE